jgi:hypothetical protein
MPFLLPFLLLLACARRREELGHDAVHPIRITRCLGREGMAKGRGEPWEETGVRVGGYVRSPKDI